MADGLLQQEFGGFDRALPEAFQYAQGYNNVLDRALDTIALRKAQQQREQFNNLMLDKARQTAPLDVEKLQDEITSGNYKLDPRYQSGMVNTIEGQGLLQKFAGKRAEETHEPRVAAENAGFNAEAMKEKLRNQLRQHIDLSTNQGVPENMRAASITQARDLVNKLAELDPDFLQKQWLQDERLQKMLESMGLRLSAKEAGPAKPENMSQMEALYRRRLAQDPNDMEAKFFLEGLEGYKVRTNPNAGSITIDPVTKKLTTKGQTAAQAGGGGPALGTKDNPIKLD